MNVEICCGDIESLAEAKRGGATRVELCVALTEGGITPPLSMIRKARELGFREINVLIRPRGGDFCYSEDEVEAMIFDIIHSIRDGATGIVTGILKPDGEIDHQAMSRLMKVIKEGSERAGRKISITFHRAFDMVSNPETALQSAIDLGCDTILTSGLAENAEEGIPMLRKLVELSDNQIKIMAGCGVTPANAKKIIESTGVDLIHSSAKKTKSGRMNFFRHNVAMGNKDRDEFSMSVTDKDIVRNLIDELHIK